MERGRGVTQEELIRYVAETYGAAPDYPWEGPPAGFVFRHPGNRKWFAVVLAAPRAQVGLPGEGTVPLVNVKCGPLLSGSFVGQPGVTPAWHMNKTQWVGARLDGSADDGMIRELLDISYEATRPRPKKRP